MAFPMAIPDLTEASNGWHGMLFTVIFLSFFELWDRWSTSAWHRQVASWSLKSLATLGKD